MHIRKLVNDQKGITIVELLVYMALFSVLLVILTDIFASALNAGLNAEAYTNVETDGRFLLAKLSSDIKRADTITLPENPGEANSTLTLVIDDNTQTYSLNGENLEQVTVDGTFQLNSSETTIANVSFQRLGVLGAGNSIKVEFTVISKAQDTSGNEIQTFTTTVGLR